MVNRPDISIATVFGEEIEKHWREHVPRECVFQLRLIAEQLMTMDKAIATQQRMIEKLMKFAIVEGRAITILKAEQKKMDSYRDQMTQTEHLEDDD